MRDCLGPAALETTSWPGPYTDPAPPGVLATRFWVLRARPQWSATSCATATEHP